MVRGRIVALLGAAAALAGCGGGDATGAGAGGGAVLAGGWDGTKACDVLKQADVEAATGQKSAPGRLEGVTPAQGGGAAVSTCTYDLADGRAVGLLLRVSEGQDLAGAVASIKNPPPDFAMGKPEDLPGVGKAALWNEPTKQLHMWLDGDHYAIFTTMRADYMKKPDLSNAKAQSIALAKRIGG